MGELRFDAEAVAYDFDKDWIKFRAYDGKKLVLCAVTADALNDMTGDLDAAGDALLGLFTDNAAVLQAIVSSKYSKGQIQPDGTVLLTTADVLS